MADPIPPEKLAEYERQKAAFLKLFEGYPDSLEGAKQAMLDLVVGKNPNQQAPPDE